MFKSIPFVIRFVDTVGIQGGYSGGSVWWWWWRWWCGGGGVGGGVSRVDCVSKGFVHYLLPLYYKTHNFRICPQ